MWFPGRVAETPASIVSVSSENEQGVARQNIREIGLSEAEKIKEQNKARLLEEKRKRPLAVREKKEKARKEAYEKIMRRVAGKFGITYYGSDKNKLLGLEFLARRWCGLSLLRVGSCNAAMVGVVSWIASLFPSFGIPFLAMFGVIFLLAHLVRFDEPATPTWLEKIRFLRGAEKEGWKS